MQMVIYKNDSSIIRNWERANFLSAGRWSGQNGQEELGREYVLFWIVRVWIVLNSTDINQTNYTGGVKKLLVAISAKGKLNEIFFTAQSNKK